MKLEFKPLSEIGKSDVIALLNHPLVKRHMPLCDETFDEKSYEAFMAEKMRLWSEHGYGPWAFVIDGHFAGWGGLQHEQGEADLALVLHPKYWGKGKAIFDEIVKRAFGEMKFKSITVLMPKSRERLKGLLRLNFKPENELIVKGERFMRYRLFRG